MLDHEVNDVAHALLHFIRLHDYLWLPDFATLLSEERRGVSVLGVLVGLTSDACMVWGTSIRYLAQMLALEGCQPLRSHGVLVGIATGVDQNSVQARESSQQHPKGTLGKGGSACGFDNIAVLLCWANLTADIMPQKRSGAAFQA